MPIRLLADIVAANADTPEAGRWRLNAGSEMQVCVDGLNDAADGTPRPVRAVVDFASMRLPAGRVVALADHDPSRPIGYWEAFAVDMSGIYAIPRLAKAENEMEAAALADAVRAAALVRNGVPIQASVGIEPGPGGTWERVEAGQTVACNGRTYSGDGELPLFILRGGELFEASIVTFGADSETGRVAARKSTPATIKANTMTDSPLKALLAKFDQRHTALVARCFADGQDEAAITAAVRAAEDGEKDTKLAAAEALVSKLRASIEAQGFTVADDGSITKPEAAGAQDAAAAARGSKTGVAFGSTDGKKSEENRAAEPKTLWEATLLVAREQNVKPDFRARALALTKYPHLKPDAKTGLVG